MFLLPSEWRNSETCAFIRVGSSSTNYPPDWSDTVSLFLPLITSRCRWQEVLLHVAVRGAPSAGVSESSSFTRGWEDGGGHVGDLYGPGPWWSLLFWFPWPLGLNLATREAGGWSGCVGQQRGGHSACIAVPRNQTWGHHRVWGSHSTNE